jgi:putative lipoprotein (rSAM/lipoprotein system)
MVRISKIYRVLISALLSLLGFSSWTCDIGGGSASEYGVPRASYKAKGVVVSESDDTPIEGIRTALKRYETSDMDTTYTDSKGSFSLEGDGGKSRKKLSVELTDVDGEENGGSFAKMEIVADYTNETFTGSSGHWYEGEAEIDLGIIRMTPAEPEEPEESEEPE